MSSSGSILVGVEDRKVWIKVDGKGNFQNSANMKEFVKAMVNRGHRDFYVDLALCPVMDSTFMGTLAGIALRLREIGQGALHVVNLNERNSGLLRSLGLDQLFFLSDMVAPDTQPATPLSETAVPQTGEKVETARVMLEAHEALVAASEDNRARFKDVLEYLKQDLNQGS